AAWRALARRKLDFRFLGISARHRIGGTQVLERPAQAIIWLVVAFDTLGSDICFCVFHVGILQGSVVFAGDCDYSKDSQPRQRRDRVVVQSAISGSTSRGSRSLGWSTRSPTSSNARVKTETDRAAAMGNSHIFE